MAFHICIWRASRIRHLAENSVTPEEFEQVLTEPDETVHSRSSGRTAVKGYTDSGRRLFCVYETIDDVYVNPITAYEID